MEKYMFADGYVNITSKVQAGYNKPSGNWLLSSAWGGGRGSHQEASKRS